MGPAEPRAVLTVLCGTKLFPSRIAPPAPSQLPPSAGALLVLWSLPFPDPFPASPTRPGAFCTEYLNGARATVTPVETRQSLGAPSGLNRTAARSTRASGWEMRGWLRAPAFPPARRTLLPVGHQQPCPDTPWQAARRGPAAPLGALRQRQAANPEPEPRPAQPHAHSSIRPKPSLPGSADKGKRRAYTRQEDKRERRRRKEKRQQNKIHPVFRTQ